ncbi:unnamed protein product, partial [Oppiella nova]
MFAVSIAQSNSSHNSAKYGSSVGHNHSPNAFPQQTNIPPQPSSTRASGHNSPTNRHKTGSSGE